MPIGKIYEALEAGRMDAVGVLELGQFHSLLDFFEAVADEQEQRLQNQQVVLHWGRHLLRIKPLVAGCDAPDGWFR